MVDRPILIDMASRANMTLISGRQGLSVWTYSIPLHSETERAVANYVASFSSSSPRNPLSMLSDGHRVVSYTPVYLIAYDVHSVFETSVGVVHRENVSKARMILDGGNGYLYDNNVAQFLESEPQIKFSHPHDDFIGNLPTFRLNATSLNRIAKETIVRSHTRRVSYYGRNNQGYTKICTPGERDIYICDIRQLYLPTFRLDLKLGQIPYYIEGSHAPSGRLLSISDNLRLCQLCHVRVNEGAIICDVCGRVTHSGGLFVSSIHGFRCKKCGRTTCRLDGFWRRKYLFMKEMVCPNCFEELKGANILFKRFRPLPKPGILNTLLEEFRTLF